MIKYNKIQGINAADIRKLCQEKKQKSEFETKNIIETSISDASIIEGAQINQETLLSEINQFKMKCLSPLPLNRWGNVEFCYTVENIIDPIEERMIIDFINSDNNRWVGQLGTGTRRHQNWGGLPGQRDLVELPAVFVKLIDILMVNKIFPENQRPNHVLINEYKDGCGLIPHDDGPLYIPIVAVISLGSTLLSYWTKSSNGQGEPFGSIYLKSRACHVTSADLYLNYLHGIVTSKEDIISSNCWNSNDDDITYGAMFERPQTRYSIVFVHKIQVI
jgi:hypothetical protein